MIRFIKGAKASNSNIDERGRWSFDFLFTSFTMTRDNDGIELVMCQTNERPEKHAEEMKRRRICHLSYNGGHLISSRHNFLINASSSSRHCILTSMSDWKLSLLKAYE
jgi:hypothetical protein